jgi:stage II sporulation protein D
MTENNENSFLGSQPEPWLRGVADPYENPPASTWKLSMSFASASAHLGVLVKGAFRGIEVLSRGVSPRILSAEVLGSAGTTPVSGPELEARLGLESTWAYFSVQSATVLRREPDLSGGATPTSPPASTPPAPAPSSPTGPQGGAQAPVAGVSTAKTGGAAAG